MFYMIHRLLTRFISFKKTPWFERQSLLIIGIGAVVAMAISLTIGLHQSVWFDEAYSIHLAKQPMAELLRLTSIDTHPPLFYILLKGWAAVFGWSEFALRSLSVLALGGSVLVAGLLTKRLFGARAMLFVLPLLVLAPFMLRYGFEIRMYALASLIGIAATYILVVALQTKDSTKQWLLYAAYAALVAIGVYTLYYLALLWIAHLVWLVWLTVQQKQSIVTSRWLLAFVASLVLFVPWLPSFAAQLSNGALSPAVTALTLEQMIGIVTFNFFYAPAWQVGVAGTIATLYVIVAMTYFSLAAFRTVRPNQHPYLVLLGLYAAIPIALLLLVSLVRPMYVERYLAHVIIGVMLFIGVTIALTITKKSPIRTWVAAGLLLALVTSGTIHLTQVGNYNYQRSQRPSINVASALINSACDDRSIIVAKDPYVAIELGYYVAQCPVYFYSETAELSGGYAPVSNSSLRIASPNDLVGLADRVYYVYDDAPSFEMPPSYRLGSEAVFDNLHVREFNAE